MRDCFRVFLCMQLPASTLVFDTETNGLPLFKEPHTHPQQPYITQLGAILYDSTWKVVAEINMLVKPVGWTIPAEVTAITGITTEQCEKFGLPLEIVMGLFGSLLNRAEVSVAHNFTFDKKLTETAGHRCAMPLLWTPERKTFCTMLGLTNICKIPSPRGFKWPKLQEAHVHLFGKQFDGAHDAMEDVRACGRVFNYGVANKLFTLP
jgi:DNA polymerase-3 subunit epsilon